MELAYAYPAPSRLHSEQGTAQLDLASSGGEALRGSDATEASEALSGPFYAGFVQHPVMVAQSLLVLARVARTRFHTPPGMVAALLRAADPVVTSTPEGLRWESFSACCGVYARLDLDEAALETEHRRTGVTNVDVNPPLRQALAGLRPPEPLHLRIGADGLTASFLDGEAGEDKVPLPTRWLKGFAESQMLMAGMTLQQELTGPAARQFLRALPRSSSTSAIPWATPSARGLRLASRPTPGAVAVPGPERLRVLEPLLRFSSALHAYGPAAGGDAGPLPSAWVVQLPGAWFTIALSPETSRGFSGEGALLHTLADDTARVTAADDADLVSALLAFDPRIEPQRLQRETGLSSDRVGVALAVLASSGQVGRDVVADGYFHRPLPMRTELLDELHPRLGRARALQDAGAVSELPDGSFTVSSRSVTYRVRLGSTAAAEACTCAWYAKHRSGRGPCAHILAARQQARSTTGGA